MYQKSEAHLNNMKVAHKKAITRNYECKHCNKMFTKQGGRRHEAVCNRIGPPCPVCGGEIKGEGKTCSHSCANTHFRSKENHPNWKESSYRSTCFHYHKKECVICGENKIVDVHHLDENKKNNKPENLIPLCPTHHKYWHSRYKNLVEEKILEYIKQWKH